MHFKENFMALFECPECKSTIERETGKCSNCGAYITICPKCDAVDVGENDRCATCGAGLKKYRKKQQAVAARKAIYDYRASGVSDLISCLRDVEEKNTFFRLLSLLKSVVSFFFWVAFVITCVGVVVAAVMGTVAFFGSSEIFVMLLGFMNLLVVCSGLPMLMIFLYQISVKLPYSVLGTLISGISAHKYEFNRHATLTLLRNPSLAYGIDDAFDRTYTIYPYLVGKSRGKILGILMDIVNYTFKILVPLLLLVVYLIYLAVLVVSVYVGGGTLYLIWEIVFAFPLIIGIVALALYIVFVYFAGSFIDIILDAIKKHLINRWASALYKEGL